MPRVERLYAAYYVLPADNWTLAATCLDYIARLSAAGKDAKMTEYPGVYHA